MAQDHVYLQAALLCEGVTTDEHGRHTIKNEFSQYTMGYSQPFTILTIWRRKKNGASGPYVEKSEIVAPDGRVVANGQHGPFSMQDSTYRQVNSTLLENVDFTHEGIYELRISLLDEKNSAIQSYVYPITVV